MPLQPMKVILDADTANEIDDLFAIARVLLDPGFDLLGLCSTHWRIHDDAPKDSVGASQVLNEELLEILQRTEVPHPIGGNMWMGKAWGGLDPRHNDAVQLMIETARAMPSGQCLTLVGQGAMTNIASAIALAPDIVPRISVHLMGFHYETEKGIWNKNEFNVRNDLNAADYLLDCEGLDLHIMTATTSQAHRFAREDAFRRLDAAGRIGAYLKERWLTHSPQSAEWIMWDLALVQAIAHPHMAEETMVLTPPENMQRKVSIYSAIDTRAMYEDFWDTLLR